MSPKLNFLSAILPLFLVCGCGASYHKKKADKDVYAILGKIEKDIFGSSSNFTIDTETSKKKPSEITAKAILNRKHTTKKIRLNIDSTLDYAIKNSREYQSEKESLYLTALTLTSERHNFRPNIFGNSRADYTRLSDGELQGGVNTNFGVNQTLKSGATLGINIANDLLRFFTGDPRRSAASALSLNIAQPLLRGAGSKIAAENLTQANRNVIYAIRDYAHFQNTFSVNIVTQYFSLLQQKDTVFNEYNNYESRKANAEYLRARVDREQPEAIGNAEQNVLEAKNRYLQAVTNYRNSLDDFKITLGLPQETQLRLDDKEIDLIRSLGAKKFHVTSSQAFDIALKHRLPLFNQIDSFEDQKRQVVIAANNLKADLNIIGGATLNNNGGPTDYTQFNFNDIRADIGLELNLPLNRLRERNQYRATLINFESSIRELSRDFDQLRNLLDREIRELEQFRQSYEIQKSAVALAKKRVEGNQLRLEAGTVIFQRLSESQDALIAAQNSETQAIVDYLEARLNLLTDLGILKSDQKNYWLKSNPSKIKAFGKPPKGTNRSEVSPDNKLIPPEKLFQ